MRIIVIVVIFILVTISVLLFENNHDTHNEAVDEIAPCLPVVNLSQQYLSLNVEQTRQEILRRHLVVKKIISLPSINPDHLWDALIATREALMLIERYPDRLIDLQVIQIDLEKKLLVIQKEKISQILLEIKRYQRLGDTKEMRYFQRKLLRLVPVKDHLLHQKIRLDLQDW